MLAKEPSAQTESWTKTQAAKVMTKSPGQSCCELSDMLLKRGTALASLISSFLVEKKGPINAGRWALASRPPTGWAGEVTRNGGGTWKRNRTH